MNAPLVFTLATLRPVVPIPKALILVTVNVVILVMDVCAQVASII